MIKYFEGNPTRNTLKVLESDEKYSVHYYRYDDENIKNKDIRQILSITHMILGTYEGVSILHEPVSEKQAIIYLQIKNRTDIKLGIYKY